MLLELEEDQRMEAIPISYMPTITPPCFTLRSRREVGTFDSINTREVERWQSDQAALQNSPRNVPGASRYMDMNPTPSRLYRENLNQAQPYVIPSIDSEPVQKALKLQMQITQSLSDIQDISDKLAAALGDGAKAPGNGAKVTDLKTQLSIKQDIYKLLLTQQKQGSIDALSQNPYFAKYDVSSDSRNIIRELRGSVSEDVSDRGIAQSQRLLRRELESRWLPADYAEHKGIDQLSAFELMRPRTNKQEKIYRT